MQSQNIQLVKLILIGRQNSGKSALLLRYVDGNFPQQYISTIGIDFKVKQTILPDGTHVKAQIWDTAGQERFAPITNSYYKGTHCFMIIYDHTNLEHFDSLEKFISKARAGNNSCPIIIVANKIDIQSEKIPLQLGKQLAEKYGGEFFPTSARTQFNLKELFQRAAALGLNYSRAQSKESETNEI